MKKLGIGISVLLLVALGLVFLGCTPEEPAPEEPLHVDASYDGKEVEFTTDRLLVVTLESNATTGFQWELAELTNEEALKYVEDKYNAPEATGLVGAGGTEEWTFKSLEKGTSIISMEYSQSWDGGMKAVNTFTLTVVVK